MHAQSMYPQHLPRFRVFGRCRKAKHETTVKEGGQLPSPKKYALPLPPARGCRSGTDDGDDEDGRRKCTCSKNQHGTPRSESIFVSPFGAVEDDRPWSPNFEGPLIASRKEGRKEEKLIYNICYYESVDVEGDVKVLEMTWEKFNKSTL